MSTRSVIANPLDGGFTGRYCHSDGYPSHMVPTLLAIVADKGLAWTRETLVEKYRSWSSIHATGDDLPGAPHTDCTGPDEEWRYTRADFAEGPGSIEWVYILNEAELSVLQPIDGVLTYLGGFAWNTEVTEDQITALECGHGFERCKHVAWAHVSPQLREEVGDLGMRQWVGLEPVGFSKIKGYYEADGQLCELSGSGSAGSARNPRDWYSESPRYWWAYPKGQDQPVRLAKIEKGQYRLLMPVLMPATSVAPAYVAPKGSLLSR